MWRRYKEGVERVWTVKGLKRGMVKTVREELGERGW